MSKQSDLIKNTAIIGIGKFSTQLIGFLLLPLYTYFLSPSEYGFFDLIMTYIVLLVPALTMQLEAASFRFLVDARSEEVQLRKTISNIAYLVAPMTVGILVVFGVAGLLLQYQHTFAILLASVSMVAINFLLQIARGLGRNKQFAIASIIIAVSISLSAVFFLAVLGMKTEGILLSIAVSNLAGALYLFWRLHIGKFCRFGLADVNLQREMLGYSAPLVPDIAAWWVINASGRTIITLILGAGANGIYAVANKYSSIFNGFFNIFGMSWTESASMHIDAKDRDDFFSSVYNTALRVFSSLGIGLIAIIPFIFPWFVDASFNQAYLYIPILVIAALLNAIAGLYAAIYIAKKFTKKVLNTSLIAALISVALTVIFTPLLGLYAAAIATVIAFLSMVVHRHLDIRKYVTISYEKRLFIVLPVIYVSVIMLYYLDNIVASSTGLIIAIITATVLNKNLSKSLFVMTHFKLKSFRKKFYSRS